MTTSGNPENETTGTVSAAYYVMVSVPREQDMTAASAGLKPLLELGIEQSRTGGPTGVKVTSIRDEVPPVGSGYKGWTVAATLLIDMGRWNEVFGPGLTVKGVAYDHLPGLISDIDLQQAEGASIDSVECKFMVWAPA
ncbi:hypothetical protein [Streptomyces sp. NPDC059761]|uniref:hypothetical protein n=1 Tax=Streptomyces sp. NPDC059761 TaxID=3346937 RepID=UPI00365B9215